jgi:hypothetical protein
MHDSIEKKLAELRCLEADASLLRYEIQNLCKHPMDLIVESEPGRDERPPFRVCRRCGYAEYGWGPYYLLCGNVIEKVTIEAASKYVRGIIMTSTMLQHLHRSGWRKGDYEERQSAVSVETPAVGLLVEAPIDGRYHLHRPKP